MAGMNIRIAASLGELRKNLSEGKNLIETTTASMKKMAAGLDGGKLIQTAHTMTAAVNQLGGATKLTDAEKKKLNATLEKAIEKYKVLGKVAPRAMLELYEATQKTETSSGGWLATITAGSVAVGSAVGTFVGKLAVDGVKKLVSGLTDLAMRGAEMAPTVRSFERLTASIGESGDAMLSSSRTATKGLIRDLDLMQAANKGILLGLPVTSSSMATMAQTAVVLGKAMNQGPTKSLDDLMTALGRSSPMILDNLGLSVQVGKANEDYARSLGKTAAQLTDAEKKTAFYTAAMDAAEKKVASLGGIQLTLMDQVERLKNRFTNFTDALGVAIVTSPAVNAVFETLGSAVDEAVGDSQVQMVKRLTLAINEMTLAIVKPLPGLLTILATMEKASARLFLNSPAALFDTHARARSEAIVAGEAGVGSWMKTLGPMIADLETKLESLRGTTGSTVQIVNDLAGGTTGGRGGSGGGGLDGAADAAKRLKERLDELTGRAMLKQVQDLAKEVELAMGQGGLIAPQFDAVARQLQDFHAAGVQLPPVLESIRVAHERLMATQKVAAMTAHQFVATMHPTLEALAMHADGSVGRAGTPLSGFMRAPQLPALNPKAMTQLMATPDLSAAQKFGQQMSATIMQAVVGGGKPMEAVGSLMGNTIGSSIAKNSGAMLEKVFGKTVGGAITAAIPGIGALLGPLMGKLSGWVVGLFTGGEGAKANDLRDSLKKQLADAVKGLENDPAIKAAMTRFNTAGTRENVQKAFDDAQKAADAARDTMSRYGLSLDQTGSATERLTRNTKQFLVDAQQLKTLGFTVQQVTAGSVSQLNAMVAAAMETGQQLPSALRPYLDELVRTNGLTEELRNKMLGIAASVPWQDMQAAAEKYGISIDDLGAKFQQAKLDETAKQMAADWQLLADNGANVGAVVAGMRDEVQDLVSKALKLGLTIPDSLKPLVESLAASGQLTDLNGDKLEDLSKLQFAKPLISETDRLISKMDELISKIGGVASAFGAIGVPDVDVPGATQPEKAHRGALVLASGIRKFHRGGANIIPFPRLQRDEFPAILQAGESVLNQGATAALGPAAITALNRGGGVGAGSIVTFAPGSIVVSGTSDPDRAAEEVVRRIPDALRRMGVVA